MRRQLLILLMGCSLLSNGQEKYHNDTIQFKGYIGIICDSTYAPFESRNIFPKNRFLPTKEEILRFESEFINQYDNAVEKHHLLFYEEYKKKFEKSSIPEEEWKQIEKYRDQGKVNGIKAQKELKKEFDEYDRSYFGYKGKNGVKYLRIQFKPHKEKWEEIPGAGESQLKNYPPLVFNLEKNELSLAGWTGEDDE